MVPIPKGARANVTDSNMYRSIAISSIMSKILDNVIIEQQQLPLATSAYQFGFKSKKSIHSFVYYNDGRNYTILFRKGR